MTSLVTLDISENCIQKIEGLDKLTQLKTLNASRNRCSSVEDIEHLAGCPSITNLDISNNKIEGGNALDVFVQMKGLRALRISGNPLVSKTGQFRKKYVSAMPNLAYLDRPVFERERVGIAAWKIGGVEAERKAIADHVQRERQQDRNSLQEFRDWQAEIKAKKMKELADRKQNGENIGYFELNDDGTRRTSAQYYDLLSTQEREKWNKRQEQARMDTEEERCQVIGNGITELGSSFWKQQDDAKQKPNLDGALSNVKQPTSPTIQHVSNQVQHISQPVIKPHTINSYQVETNTTQEANSEKAPSIVAATNADRCSVSKPETEDQTNLSDEFDLSKLNLSTHTDTSSAPPAPIVRETWETLTQRSFAKPMSLPITSLPSMNIQEDDEEDHASIVLSREQLLHQVKTSYSIP